MKISEVSRRSAVPPSTLRYYETVGLLAADRTPSGYREYTDEVIDRLAVIDRAKRLGLRLDDIAEVLDAWSAGSCAATKAQLRPRLSARLADTLADAARLQARAAAVQVTLAHLETLPDNDEPCGPDCVLPRESAPPIACSLNGGQRAERVTQWQELLADADRTPLPDGVRVSLPAARAADVAVLAADELACCPFLRFDLRFDRSWLHLDVTGPEGAGDMLTEVFAPVG